MVNNDILAIKDDIVRTIGDDCERVYHFGSYAYGTPRIGGNKPSDYDFYVVLRDESDSPLHAMQKIHRTLAYKPITLDVDVLAQTINLTLKNEVSIFRLKRKLHTKECCSMNATEHKIANTKDWFRHSTNNLIVAMHSLNDLWPKQTEIAAYLSQQAAETALKGFLYYSGVDDPEHTHNLEKLCQQCMKYDDSFSSFLDFCADLTHLEAKMRYPYETAPTDEIKIVEEA
jgi:HEPN domain-containing protein/predicted nucleotidyltransferase